MTMMVVPIIIVVVKVRATYNLYNVIVVIVMSIPRADFVDIIFKHALAPATVMDLLQIRWRPVHLMDEMDSLVVFAVTLADAGIIEALLGFEASEIPCLGVIAVVSGVALTWDESPLIRVG